MGNALRAELELARLTVLDLLPGQREKACNLCGWRGNAFYPNTGPGYDERRVVCPGCGCLARYRTLALLLERRTDFLAPPRKRVVEVAPARGFQALCQAQGLDYTSFDLARFATEQGDITQMRYPDASLDYFLCFHVLEHVPAEQQALREIRRVLRPGGTLVTQVPVDWRVAETYEYEKPDPREVNHVRRYGRDFETRIARAGFEVAALRAGDFASAAEAERMGLDLEPIFVARKPGTIAP